MTYETLLVQPAPGTDPADGIRTLVDRKSTRLNSSH